MYPLFYITPAIEVHFFGILLVIAWGVFFLLLSRYSTEQGIIKNIYQDIVPYTLSMFIWGRVVYMLTDWRNEKYIIINFLEGGGIAPFLRGFFITENYSLSFAGGVLGFFLVFAWKAYHHKIHLKKHLDVLVRAFFWAGIIGYTGTLLGGQIYGAGFDSWFSLVYGHKNSIVPIGSARFPLPIIYIIVCLVGALSIQKIRKTVKNIPDGFVSYIGFGIFGFGLFLGEFMSGSADMFASYPPYLGINQIFAVIFLGYSLVGILRTIKF